MSPSRPPRVLLVQDSTGHSTGFHVVARGLRDAGVEVLLGGALVAPDIARLAADEAVDAVGYRIMDAAPVILVERLRQELVRAGLAGLPVVVGGIVPEEDLGRLATLGVAGVFRPGATLNEIGEFFQRFAPAGRTEPAAERSPGGRAPRTDHAEKERMVVEDDGGLARRVERWQADTLARQRAALGERKERFETDSGIPVKALYTPLDLAGREYLPALGFPGEYPFTRGADPNMYRSRIYGTAQFTGFATPAETNELYRRLLAQGMTSLYMACDLPCQLGYDSDDPRAAGEVGQCGVAINSLQDMETIFAGIDLATTRITIVANANAPVILAMLDVVAERQGVDRTRVTGFVQNDILKEFFARNTFIFPIEPSLRLHSDTVVFCREHLPSFQPFNPISYQIREAGATAVQEAAFTLANAATYVENAAKRGIPADELGPLFFTIIVNHRDFFEEIAKVRAMRRIWARLLRHRLGATRDEACALRFHASQGAVGLNLTRSLPEANIARCTLAGFAGVLSGAQSVGIRTMDEAFGIPSARASLVSLRTLQIIAEETGVTNIVDPLAGSYFVEWLTDEVEKRIDECLAQIDAVGGMVAAIKSGYVQNAIAQSAFAYQMDLEQRRKITVGMNLHVDPVEAGAEHAPYTIDPALQEEQIRQLRAFRRQRDSRRLAAALDTVRETAARPESNENNLMPPIREAVKAHATIGEIVRALKDVFGEQQTA